MRVSQRLFCRLTCGFAVGFFQFHRPGRSVVVDFLFFLGLLCFRVVEVVLFVWVLFCGGGWMNIPAGVFCFRSG